MAKLLSILLSNDNTRSLFAGVMALIIFGLVVSPAASAQGKVNEVPIAKLMAPDELSELSIGKKDAPITIVEYMSMSCPACANFHKTTYPKLKKKYIDTDKVRFVIREFPLNNLAAAGSMLARCAKDDDASIALIDVLFSKQKTWVSNNAVVELSKIAKQVGFTQKKFEQCLKNTELLDKLIRRRDKADKEFGIDATPSFFINGKRLRVRNFTLEAFEKVIKPLLKDS